MRDLTGADLDAIVADSRRANEASGITGVLLYCDGNFMQYLEGPSLAVAQAYGRILASRRHHGINDLMNEPILRREFSHWALGFASVFEVDFFDLSALEPGEGPGPGREMLRTFWRNCRSAGPD